MNHSHYIYLRLSSDSNELKIRQNLQNCLHESFGVAMGSIYLDILSVKGRDVVLRANASDAKAIMAAVTSSNTSSPEMRVSYERSSVI
ncbi:hypothetical protein Moror_5708, partial [Moniliophthora roreri MCA 2997]